MELGVSNGGGARRARHHGGRRRWFGRGSIALVTALVALGVAPSSGAVVALGRAPGAPRAVAVVSTGRSGELRVVYLPPTSRGTAKVVKYAATCKAKGRTPRSAADATAPFGPITVEGMVNGVTYACTVRATNAVGRSARSAAWSARVGAPSPPRSVLVAKATAAGSLAVSLGTASTPRGAPITKYLGVCTAAGATARTFTTAASARRATVRGLKTGKSYRCEARAANKFGAGPYRTQATCSGANAKVNLDRGSGGTLLQSGRAATVCGTGFRPGARVALILHSTPIHVGSIAADSNGMIHGSVGIPSSVPDGSHTLIATGASVNGTLTESAPVTVKYDIQPPALTGFSLSPTSVDTSAATQTITVTASITDDLSGNGTGSYVEFRSPSGQYLDAWLGNDHLISGTSQDGVVSSTLTVPRFSERGTWTADYLQLVDKVGNRLAINAEIIGADGFPSTFQETGASDTQAPKLTAFSISPTSVSTAYVDQTVTITAAITDDLSGNGPAASYVQFQGPSGQYADAFLGDEQRVSGTPQGGVVSYAMTLPHFAARGTWTADYLQLVDQADNRLAINAEQLAALGFPNSFQQTGPGDTTPPQLTALSISPASIDTSTSDQTVTVTASITDDLSGNGTGSYVEFRSPHGQYVDAMLGEGYRISGTPQNCVVSYSMTIPASSEQGTWTAQYLEMDDQVGNRLAINAEMIAGLGFPTTFTNGP